MPDFQDLAYILEADLERFRNIERGEGYDLQAFSFDEVMQVREVHQNKILSLPNPTFSYQNKRPEYLSKLVKHGKSAAGKQRLSVPKYQLFTP
jgi:hypothetical protein